MARLFAFVIAAMLLLTACGEATPTPADAFKIKLVAAGYTNPTVAEVAEDGRQVLNAAIKVRGCSLQLQQVVGQESFRIKRLMLGGEAIAWPDSPVSPLFSATEGLVMAIPAKPAELTKCRR